MQKIKINVTNEHLSNDTNKLYLYLIEFYQDSVKFLRRELLFYYMEHNKIFTDAYLKGTLRKKFDEEMHMMEYVPAEVVNLAFEQFGSRKKQIEKGLKKKLDEAENAKQIFEELESLFSMDFKLEDVVKTFIPYKKS